MSHLRFGPQPIRSTYLITEANFVACHQFSFLERIDVLKAAEPGATFLLNSPFGPDEVWDHLPRLVQQQIIDKKLKFYVIDGYEVARRPAWAAASTPSCRPASSRSAACCRAKRRSRRSRTRSRRRTASAARRSCRRTSRPWTPRWRTCTRSKVPDKVTALFDMRPPVPGGAPEFVQKVTAQIIAGEGDDLPVSAMPVDGTFPTGTAQWEKRNIALEIPVWDEELCIQCGKCVLVCPHGVIRAKVYDRASWTARPGRSRRSRRAGRT